MEIKGTDAEEKILYTKNVGTHKQIKKHEGTISCEEKDFYIKCQCSSQTCKITVSWVEPPSGGGGNDDSQLANNTNIEYTFPNIENDSNHIQESDNVRVLENSEIDINGDEMFKDSKTIKLVKFLPEQKIYLTSMYQMFYSCDLLENIEKDSLSG